MASTKTQIKYRGIKPKHKSILKELNEKSKLVWDSEKKLILGRPPARFLFCILLYVGVIGVSFIILILGLLIHTYLIIDANYPTQVGNETPLQQNPGLSVRPQPDLQTTLIRFIQGDPSSYKVHLDHIQTFVEQYENRFQTGENYVDCSTGDENKEKNQVCRFNIDDLGEKCTWQQEYGYDEGQPCVLIKINKIYGWQPEPYAPGEVPEEIRDVYQPNFYPVTCDGETPVDRENIGNLTFFPRTGFPHYFFPYVNQEDYRQPIVMVRFENPVNGVVINVWCRVWAKNIYHHRYDMQGSVHFEILID